MRLAPIAARLSTLEDHPPLLQNVEARRHLGKGARRSGQASAGPPEAGPSAERRRDRDSQSVKKSTGVEGDQRGYDGGKRR